MSGQREQFEQVFPEYEGDERTWRIARLTFVLKETAGMLPHVAETAIAAEIIRLQNPDNPVDLHSPENRSRQNATQRRFARQVAQDRR